MASVTARGEDLEKAASRANSKHHPLAFWFFFWGEFAERCSFYGMRAILPLYLTAALHFSLASANKIYFSFKMACYILPLLGGFLADRFFGKYWTIVAFSVPYVLGHFILGIESNVALFIALGLLAGGSGVIKPNISTLMGLTYDQQRPGNERLRSSAFLWFYFAINVGATISSFAMPSIRDESGYAVAFQFPAWLMVVALIVFAGGKKLYAVDIIDRRIKTPEERRQQWQTFGQLCGVFALIVFFWVAYEQADILWTYFAKDYVDLSIPALRKIPEMWGISEESSVFTRWILQVPGVSRDVAPDQIQFLNPLFVLIFVPLFSWLLGKIDPKVRVFTATKKILIGFALTAASTAIVSIAGYLNESTGEKVSLAWVASAFVVLTAGEVLLYGTGLELAYTAAPKTMKGFVTGCFLLTNMLGNLINLYFCDIYGGKLSDPIDQRGLFLPGGIHLILMPGAFFAVTSSIVVAATIGFYFVGRRFDKQPKVDNS